MPYGKAIAIMEQIDSDRYSDEEKALAIYKILSMETINGVTKETLRKGLKWLWNRCFEINE